MGSTEDGTKSKKRRSYFTLEQKQDVRSLAAFRILAGFYLVYDIVSRLQHGRFSLLWYTSTENSFLLSDDTPHRSPVHRIWFYRGSEWFQLTLFLVTFLLSLSFACGYKCNAISKTLLWLNVVAMQCRCMPSHDGSDTFFRHLLLWSIQLPMSQVWSLDSFISERNLDRNRAKQKNSSQYTYAFSCNTIIHNRAAVWGIRLQIVIMYFGTVMHRTVDTYGLFGMHKSKWLPPQLTAVHYALNGTFSPRQCWLGDFVRQNLTISQIMTLMAMLMEGCAPIFCLIMGDRTHIPAFLLFKLHFGLLVLMNLPNWQVVGMIASIIWTPSWVWDNLQRRLAKKFPSSCRPPSIPMTTESLQKKDMVSDVNMDMDASNFGGTVDTKKRKRRRPFLTYFFLSYMLYDFVGNRKWIQKIDHGDVGEFLRFSQYWVMFTGPSTTGSHVMITGSLEDKANVNVWEWIKNKNNMEVINLDAFEQEPWTNMTHVYPSPRIERAMSEWSSTKDRGKSIHFLESLCDMSPFLSLKLIIQTLDISPPGSEDRFSKSISDIAIEVDCTRANAN